jgi:glycosyltransferase involved in cell wall biosynthesis
MGGFDQNLNRFQDFDLHTRVLLNGGTTIKKYPHENIDCFYRESQFLKEMTKDKKLMILNNAIYLIKKYEKINVEFYKAFYQYLFKYYDDVMTDEMKIFLSKKEQKSLSPEDKLKILLLPDAHGWAFDNIATSIIKYNPYPNKISYFIKFTRDIKRNKEILDTEKYDAYYIMFEGEDYFKNDKTKIIRGCYSAHWLENPKHTPEFLGERFSNNRGVVFVNHFLEKKIEPYLSDDITHTVIYDSSDDELFYPIENKKLDKFTAIFVGNTDRPIKNFGTIKRICDTTQINLIIAKDIPHKELVHEYAKADICINFSESEGGPQTFAESALCGVPMLIRDTICLSEKIPCFTGKNEKDFINIIEELKFNRQKCMEVGKKARNVVLSDFTYKKTAKRFADFFIKIDSENKIRIKNSRPYLSFIIPIRGRDDQMIGLEYNIKKYFDDFNYEILYVNQKDNKLFKRGQLCNAGFKESKGDIIIFQDVDIRHLRKIDPEKLLNDFNSPFVAFDKITQIYENRVGNYEKIQTEDRPYGWGACSIFYREHFINSGGFSNLVFGWGAEDNILNSRSNFKRLLQDLGHVYHEPLRKNSAIFESEWHKNNVLAMETDSDRDHLKDGYLQTMYDINIIQKDSNIKFLNISNIRVCKDYEYKILYENYSKNDK